MALVVRTASRPRVDRPDEDAVLVGPEEVVLLDGAGLPEVVRPGDVVRYVTALGDTLLAGLRATEDLRSVLAEAIDTCPDIPGTMAAVAIVRRRQDRVEVLVLGDCSVLVLTDSGLEVVHDRREVEVRRACVADHSSVENQTMAFRGQRNVAGGFWVATGDPLAAAEALVRVYPVSGIKDIVLVSNGVTGLAPAEILAVLHHDGPQGVVERSTLRDDATVAWVSTPLPGPP